MQTREQVIKGLEDLRVVYHSNQMLHPKDFVNQHDMEAIDNALDLLKSLSQEYPKDDFSDHFLGLSEMTFVDQAPRILTMEEINVYIFDDDDDKDPLWVQWATDSVKGGWVLANSVDDLVRRYGSIYHTHWVLWTRKPSEEQRKTVIWNA